MKQGSFLVRLVINALAFLIVSSLYSGMSVRGLWGAVVAALIWGIVNALLRPFLVLLTLPLNILTFGLFTFVINAVMILITSEIVKGFMVEGFWSALIAAVIMSGASFVLNLLLSETTIKPSKEN